MQYYPLPEENRGSIVLQQGHLRMNHLDAECHAANDYRFSQIQVHWGSRLRVTLVVGMIHMLELHYLVSFSDAAWLTC
jgi:hypothetical protein